MAVTKEDLLIQIKADSGKAVQGLESVIAVLGSLETQLKAATVAQKKSASSLTDFGAIAAKTAGFLYVAKTAAEALASGFQKTVGEYYKSEDGMRRLANALALVGEQNIPRSLAMFKSLASAIQETTTIEDDQVIALAALGVAAGRTDKEVKKLITTSVDIAAVTGESVDTAFKQLLDTYKGMTRSLEYLSPELKNLTDQQVMAGAAVDLLAVKFAGAGAGLAGTFSGQVQQAKNALGDLAEETGRVLAKAFNIDQVSVGFNKAIQTMTDFLAENGAAIAATLAGIKQAFLNFVSSIGVAILGLTEGMLTPFAKSLGIGTGLVEKLARANQALRDSMVSLQAASEKAFASYQRQVQATVATTEKSRRAPAAVASPEGKNLLKELDAKVREMQKNAELANKTELEQIRIKADWQLKDLKLLEDKLKKEHALTEEAKKKLAIARDATKEQEKQEQLKLEKSVNAAVGSFAKSGDSGRDGIRQQFADMQKLLDMKREFLFMKGPPPASAVKDLEAQQQILEKRKAAATAAVPSNEFENAKASGEVIAGKISGAITGPAMGAITGAMQGAMSVIGAAQGAIDMAQSLLDAVPRLLESFAGLVDTLTNLPLRLAEAVGKVFTSLINFVRNFFPNIVKMLDTVLEGVVSFVENLPQVFMQMVDNLSTMLTNLIEKLPQLAERLVEGLVEGIPEIAMKFIEFIITRLPDLAMRLTKVLAIRLPLAIFDGVMKGLSKVRDMFADLFKGKWPKALTPPAIQVDGKQAAKTIAQLTADTNKLFSVNALQDAAKSAQDQVAGITEAAAKAGKTMWEYFLQGLRDGWEWLKEAGGKIWDGLKDIVEKSWNWVKTIGSNIWEGFKSAVGKAWDWVKKIGGAIWDGVTNAVGDVAKKFGEWGAAIWQGVIDAVGKLAATFGAWGQAIWDGLLNAVGKISERFDAWGQAIWDGLLGAVGDIGARFGEWGGKIWDGFLKPIGNKFTEFGNSIAESLKAGVTSLGTFVSNLFQNIGRTFANLFKVDASGAIDGLKKAFNEGGNTVKSAFTNVINPLIDIFNGLIDALNGIKIPEIGYSINAGMLGSWSGTLVREIDLIPGNIDKIAKFAQGGLVQGPGGTDRVPAMLTAGEFVMSRPAVEAIGLPTLRAMNSGQTGPSNVTQHYTFNLKIDAKEKVDETFIKQRLMPAIREELKRGSLDGRAIVYAGGVRA